MTLACELGDTDTFRRTVANKPDFASTLSDDMARKLPDAAQSNNAQAVRLMLEAGWPVNTPGEMGAAALHWAAFNGNPEMTAEILRFRPALELKSAEYSGSALSWAIYASGNGWRRDGGDFVTTVRLLLQAGAIVPPHAEDLEPCDSVLELLP
jgi:ankyrin repeat protein